MACMTNVRTVCLYGALEAAKQMAQVYLGICRGRPLNEIVLSDSHNYRYYAGMEGTGNPQGCSSSFLLSYITELSKLLSPYYGVSAFIISRMMLDAARAQGISLPRGVSGFGCSCP